MNHQRMGHAANDGMGDRKQVWMNQSTCLLPTQYINERMGRSTAHLLTRPLNLPMNESTNEAVSARPRSTIQRNTIPRNII